ncbi:MAG TPA: hypothetical protein VF765_25570 [Polyangiaceae bacterium]
MTLKFTLSKALRALALRALALHALIVTAVLLEARAASADGPFEGQWTMTPVAESFTVQQWTSSCGPAPVSGTLVPGGAAMVTGSGGELVIQGPRTLRTDACLDPLPTLARSVHTSDAHSWRTRCQTPPSDPRRAVINTAYFGSADGNSISIAETGRYEFTVNGAQCIADVKRSGSLSRVVAATPTPTATITSTATATTTPTPPPPNPYAVAPKVDCSSPGDPALLQVRPSRKLLKVGDTFGFRGVVLDASGCPTGTAITWTVGTVTFSDGQAHAGQPSIDASGKLTVPSTDFGDATFDVVATAAGKSAHVSVEVAAPADYSALLAQSGLDPNGERDEPAIAVIATSSIGAEATRAQDAASRKKRFVFIGVVASLALMLGVVALFGARRARKAKLVEAAASERHAEKMRAYEKQKAEREAQHAAQMKKHLEGIAIAQQQTAAMIARGLDTGPMFCPSCRKEYPARTAFCAVDSNRLISIRGHEALLGGPSGGICPVCHRGFNPGVKVCPDHGEELLPASVAGATAAPQAQQAAAATPRRGKICPKCGARFDGNSAFCGQDGSALVLVN